MSQFELVEAQPQWECPSGGGAALAPSSRTSTPPSDAERLRRQEAVREVLTAHPEWADRRIGTLCDVSPRTVGRIRAQVAAAGGAARAAEAEVRIGRDGRARPVDPGAQRSRIVAAIAERPDASLRVIARAVGVSPETVRSVRAALAEPTPIPDRSPISLDDWRAARARAARWEPDHAFTSHDDGRAAARFLERTDVCDAELEVHVGAIPRSRVYEVSDEARRRAAFWTRLAERVEARARRERR